jgi:hypothetical protein
MYRTAHWIFTYISLQDEINTGRGDRREFWQGRDLLNGSANVAASLFESLLAGALGHGVLEGWGWI